MRSILYLFLFSTAQLASLQSANCQEIQEPPTGFTSLFNGTDLTGWVALKTYNPREFAALDELQREERIKAAKESTGQFWRVEQGEIVNDGEGPYLTTEKEFRDFELLIEYSTVAKADSGIYLKATPQVQIWDTTEEKKFEIGANLGSGGLWNNSQGANGKNPLELADRPFGEWNQFRIRQIGSRTDVWLNSKHVVQNAIMENYWDKSRNTPLVCRGPIQLQTHGGQIRWRNIFVREIPAAEANQVLASHAENDFVSIFNGKDFTGWKGPTEHYEIVDGSICCKTGKGHYGTIFTTESYSDFVASMEFRLPPNGNNGLAIRYPGTGDPAYTAMCELQVLDNEAPENLHRDPRQFHGAAYGMVAPERGYLRPTGDWNYQEVTVTGSKIKVELNGTMILNCDLGEVSEFMDGKAHPGKENTSGHFGFAGHNSPVQFRNVKIKRLQR